MDESRLERLESWSGSVDSFVGGLLDRDLITGPLESIDPGVAVDPTRPTLVAGVIATSCVGVRAGENRSWPALTR